ncbi:hypothetical protein N9Q98_00420 [bacterium]|nr:hypothetical protein [bacterium]MDB4369321.1 hypothetical protein [Akkermansiaceae bacterium]MDC1205987.1 hypothetical protein [Akkermansiaceae bacterium]
MSEEKEKNVSGRLRAEDRRGRVVESFYGDDVGKRVAEAQAPPNPEEQWEEKKTGRWGGILMITLSLVLLGILVGVVMNYFFAEQSPAAQARAAEKSERIIGPLHFGEKTTPEEIKVSITATVKGFMEAKSPEEASHFVLGGVKKIPLMKEFASRVGEVSPAGFGELIELKAGAFGGVPIQVAVVSEADGKSAWRFLLVPMSDRYLIDWEASVAYGEMSWKAFLRERPTGQTCLRVYLHRDHHQPGLPTEAENDFYRVQARVEKWALVSFVGKDSPIAEELKKIVPPSSSQPVRIVMKWDEDKLTSEIVGIRHNYWINLSEYRAELLRDGKSP